MKQATSETLPNPSHLHSLLITLTETLDSVRSEIKELSNITSCYRVCSSQTVSDRAPASFLECLGQNIKALNSLGQRRTAETYRSALNSFRTFLCDRYDRADIHLSQINRGVMEDYQKWLHGRGLVPNTTSFYNRILRAVYNRAVEEGLTEQRHPFSHVYTGVEKTAKRAVSMSSIRRMKDLDLSQTPSLEYARDMFFLSFYLRGMSFIDMAFLKKNDLRHGVVSYRRRKTGQKLSVKWTDEMQAIIRRYPSDQGAYLLPLVGSESHDRISQYRRTSQNINHNLHTIGRMIGLTTPLTLYVARHSWASIAYAHGIPVETISRGLGHDSERTTRIYIAELSNASIDRANAMIIKACSGRREKSAQHFPAPVR